MLCFLIIAFKLSYNTFAKIKLQRDIQVANLGGSFTIWTTVYVPFRRTLFAF